jgi:hypothetical protein
VLQHTPSTQLPLRHWPLVEQVWPLVSTHALAPLPPLQALGAAQVLSVCPEGTLVQVPTLPVTLQAWQVVAHAVLQQTPSTQLPLRHWPLVEQLWPLVSTHAPVPLHTLGETQVPAGELSVWPDAMLVQVPTLPVMLHAWQVPVHAVLQHTPSTQLPLTHWPLLEHAAPLASWQTPAPLHCVVHAFVGKVSGEPAGRLVQVPTLPVTPHDWHVVVQALLQQKPSTQLPLAHWLLIVHIWPLPSWHVPEPLHTLVPAQPGASCWPSGTLAQVPEPLMLHDWQFGQALVLQQVLSTQLPLAHWPAPVQVLPLVRLGTHADIRQKLPAEQSPSEVQLERHAPAPLHVVAPQLFLGSVSSATLPQMPSAPEPFFADEQAVHTPLQALLQHTPSTQKPLAQSAAFVPQAWPTSARHEPAPLQALGAMHGVVALVSCWPAGALEQVPMLPVTLQAWQVPVHALLQHTPSAQKPLAHWVLAVHVVPLLARQVPAPLQVFGAVHVPGSCWKAGTLAQVPTLPVTLQAWQVPAHVELQQTPSMQLPLKHWLLSVHAEPLLSRQVPAPSQALPPVQALAGKLSCWPAGTLTQVPTLPMTLHARHVPVHALLQHTPSTQLPLRHWLALEQA